MLVWRLTTRVGALGGLRGARRVEGGAEARMLGRLEMLETPM